jgi:cell division protein FtsB
VKGTLTPKEKIDALDFLSKRGSCETFLPVPRVVLLVERILPIAILVMAVVGAPAMMLAPEGLPRLRSLSKELSHIQNENTELRQQIRHLRGRVQHLRDDPAAVERIARDELGLVRTSEVVFQFPRR